MTVSCRIKYNISMTVQRGMCKVIHGWHEEPITKKNKYKNKIRLQDTERVCKCASVQMSKWHWQLWGSYEVESNNECVISDLK